MLNAAVEGPRRNTDGHHWAGAEPGETEATGQLLAGRHRSHRGVLRRRLLLLFALTSVAPALLTWAMTTRTASRAALDLLLGEVSAERARGTAEIGSALTVARATLSNLARSEAAQDFVRPGADALEETALRSVLRGLATEYAGTIAAIGVMSADGRALSVAARYDGGETRVGSAGTDEAILRLAAGADPGPGAVHLGGTLDDRAGRLAPLITGVPGGGHAWLQWRLGAVVERAAAGLQPNREALTFVTDAEGVVVYARDDAARGLALSATAPEWAALIDRPPDRPASTVWEEGGGMVLAYGALGYPGWSLVVGTPLTEVTGATRSVAARSLLGALVGVAVALTAVTLVTRRIGRNVDALTEGASRVASGDLSTSVGLATGDELEDLSAAFDEMTRRLRRSQETLVASARALAEKERLAELGRFAAVIAHELKNPLGIMRVAAGSLDTVARDSEQERRLKKILMDEMGRLDHTLRRLLEHARRDKPCLVRVDLGALVRDLADGMAREFARHGVRLVVETPAKALPVRADPDQLRGAVLNIVLNARQASPRGAEVRLVLSPEPDGGGRIEVTDSGPGIPASLRERLFQPFVSGREGGIGLGLANARAVFRAHGGDVMMENVPEGGTRAVMRLPASGAADERTRS